MTPENLRAARKSLGLTQTQMADALRLSEKNGARSIRIWEKDGNTVPGPVQIAVGYMMREHEAKGRTGKHLENPA